MNLIPRKEVVEENASVSRVRDMPRGASRMTSVIVEAYASIVVKKYAGAEEFPIAGLVTINPVYSLVESVLTLPKFI